MKAALRLRAAPGPLAPAAAAHEIGRAAVLALHDELALSPKPGLVSFLDNGSHEDMDAHTFMRSLFALRHYFPAIFELGRGGVAFARLEACGLAAEQRMLAATGGINTHRGAVFSLGLLCAAAGAVVAEGGRLHPAALRDALRRHWGAALADRARRVSVLPGGVAARRYGLRSASQEAALGFPVIFETAAPALARASACGLTPQQARIDTLFAVMAVLDDSNLAHRGGLEGLRFAQDAARRFLERGGIAAPDGLQHARAVHRDFVARRLSPGGAADALAAACWLRRICASS
ncbi:triphosphoribosyl-dephospho-CoA synthase MdcB [Variovorax saccharolyticus]|uniref:triphosphoribosyl-dephospho-CoA synthase MdcB n=1 Tax=Variovorax saccharolyticus TaxID=3053516 RepID=UPI0025774D50|nr:MULTISPECIES: triphosphoribosyl-dephospho-CoA synthase MdcB [unclassified Variovorax]MDM0019283.1 triphosphoribosyl-dephospho-CoA synthase MdcB [Variovorax sp. J22R187]MDM0026151.1 triphosphoribosyl-dephospho-CoA synthase MdcB [Variovorax sp. J31P216]